MITRRQTRAALTELAHARVRQRAESVDVWEALYRVYATLILVGGVIFVASLVLGDPRLSEAGRGRVLELGPAIADVAAALAVAGGLRSGARGGPLLVEEPDVMLVLLAPVPRREAIRRAILKHLRSSVGIGAIAGATAGLLLAQRVRGGPSWVVAGAAAGAAVGIATSGAAMLAAGRRLPAWTANVLGAALVACAALVAWRSPGDGTFGAIAYWPADGAGPAALAGLAAAGLVLVLGLAVVPGTALEDLRRRSRLVALLRFSAGMNDVRAVTLARRALAQEGHRSRPWLTLRPSPGTSAALGRRVWHGVLRWPVGRVARMLVLGAVAGVAARLVWSGATPLIAIAGIALFAAALEATEALGSLADRPTLRDSFPLANEQLELRTLAAGTPPVLVPVLGAIGGAFAVAPSLTTLAVGAAMLAPATLSATAGAAVSTLRRKAMLESWEFAMPAEAISFKLLWLIAWPPAVATTGLVPLLVARRAADPVIAALVGGVPPVLLAAAVFAWVARPGTSPLAWEAMTALLASGLEKRYGDLVALAPLSLRVDAGRLVALVGPNGAGKTTLLQLAAGVLEPTAGSVRVCGHAPGSLDARRAVSFVADTPVLYDDLGLLEHCELVGKLHGFEAWPDRADELIAQFGLRSRADDRPATFSRGMRQKAAIVLGLLRPFELLLIDEPFVGLDAPGRDALVNLVVRASGGGATVVLSTHQPDFLTRAERCVGMREGQVVYDGPPEPELLASLAGDQA